MVKAGPRATALRDAVVVGDVATVVPAGRCRAGTVPGAVGAADAGRRQECWTTPRSMTTVPLSVCVWNSARPSPSRHTFTTSVSPG